MFQNGNGYIKNSIRTRVRLKYLQNAKFRNGCFSDVNLSKGPHVSVDTSQR